MTTTKTAVIYSGVCIGGALDGQRHDSAAPSLAAELPEAWLTKADNPQSTDEARMPSVLSLEKSRDDYRFVKSNLREGDKILGFWVLSGIKEEDVYKRLVGAYARVQGIKGQEQC